MSDLLSELRSTYTAADNAERLAFKKLMEEFTRHVRLAASDRLPSRIFEAPVLEAAYADVGYSAPDFVERVASAFCLLGLTAEVSSRSDGPNESTTILVVSGWAS